MRNPINFFRSRPYIFLILPAFILYTLFFIYPVLSAIPYSLLKWNGIAPPQFAGLDNYKTVFTHPAIWLDFRRAVLRNLYLLVIAIIIMVPLITFLAYILYRRILGHQFFRVVLLCPYFINSVTISFIATLVFNPSMGLIQFIAGFLGKKVDISPFFSETLYSVPMIASASFWNSMGYSMLILLAAMVMTPRDTLEQAQIDGASEWQCFVHVFMPQIRPTLVNVIIIHYIWAISIFDMPYLLGGIHGGVNKSMDFVNSNYYRVAFGGAYMNNSVGLGTTLAVIISSIVLVGTVIQLGFFNRKGETA
jgi:ABC-type sugar transport system permease subunit